MMKIDDFKLIRYKPCDGLDFDDWAIPGKMEENDDGEYVHIDDYRKMKNAMTEAMTALESILSLDTGQEASNEQISAVVLAMDARDAVMKELRLEIDYSL